MEGAAQISGILNSAKLPRWSSPRLQKTGRFVARSTQAVAVGSTGELGWSTDLGQFYKLENMIGAGSYGIVRAAEHLHTGQKVRGTTGYSCSVCKLIVPGVHLITCVHSHQSSCQLGTVWVTLDAIKLVKCGQSASE